MNDQLPKKRMCVNKIQTADGFEFTVDPDILISRSKYFKAIYEYNRQACIHLSGVNGDTMKQILNFLEKGNMILDGNNILGLLEAADYLMLDEIVKEIRSVLPKEISPSNCIDFFNASLNLNHLDIFHLCCCFIKTHFESVVKYANVGKMSFEHLKQLLNDKDLVVDSEDTVWSAVVKWIESDEQGRISLLPQLLSCVRLDICTKESIRKIVSHPLLYKSETYNRVFTRNLLNRDEITPENVVSDIRRLSGDSTSLGARQNVVLSISKKDCYWNGNAEITVKSNDGMTKITKFHERSDFYPEYIFYLDRRIYIFDIDGSQHIYFDLLASTWHTVTPPENTELDIIFLLIDSRMYGMCSDNVSHCHRVTFYVPELNLWQESCNTMPFPSNRHSELCSAAVHEGLIYAVTAYYQERSLRSFGTVYDPKTDTWSEFALPELQSSYMKIVLFKETLLIIEAKSRSVLRFDFTERIWKAHQVLPMAFLYPEVAIQDGILFIRGYRSVNDYEQMDEDESVVYWNDDSDEWLDGSSLYSPTVDFTIDDADVVRKYHRLMMNEEWETLVREWNGVE